ncbi:hypothetical protein BC832DRAFT_482007 [Gaertneriomyces semiglobifer]|nr:hypothetical protein BC832DRAFT_482007 [Gaertneriomyces semiglobifer]
MYLAVGLSYFVELCRAECGQGKCASKVSRKHELLCSTHPLAVTLPHDMLCYAVTALDQRVPRGEDVAVMSIRFYLSGVWNTRRGCCEASSVLLRLGCADEDAITTLFQHDCPPLHIEDCIAGRARHC